MLKNILNVKKGLKYISYNNIMENRIYIIISNIPKIIRNIKISKLSLFKEHKPPQLGRWGLIYDNKIDYRIDLANEDHCGPCGELKLKSTKSTV